MPRMSPDVGKNKAKIMLNVVSCHFSPGVDCTVAICAAKFPRRKVARDGQVRG